ncbi:hypothetical protein [Dyella sp.]|uniref:hypothetical protein n=1 Tax=Dyella sp. TaxID=1869338 RepID=UPI002B48EB10|nr:hypothetical protein [Dyella sp.]HKT28786.1 hypothetical protein [Dyella sp.]
MKSKLSVLQISSTSASTETNEARTFVVAVTSKTALDDVHIHTHEWELVSRELYSLCNYGENCDAFAVAAANVVLNELKTADIPAPMLSWDEDGDVTFSWYKDDLIAALIVSGKDVQSMVTAGSKLEYVGKKTPLTDKALNAIWPFLPNLNPQNWHFLIGEPATRSLTKKMLDDKFSGNACITSDKCAPANFKTTPWEHSFFNQEPTNTE